VARDTVDSVGLIPRTLPFTTSNTILRTFRHAVSLDERRAKFKANLWNRPTAREAALGTAPAHLPPNCQTPRSSIGSMKKEPDGHQPSSSFSWLDEDEVELAKYQNRYSAQDPSTNPTDIDEVWFAGCHCGM
jgi:uncharacterized protein (DUF2235 family)